jgi:hypothetical protein
LVKAEKQTPPRGSTGGGVLGSRSRAAPGLSKQNTNDSMSKKFSAEFEALRQELKKEKQQHESLRQSHTLQANEINELRRELDAYPRRFDDPKFLMANSTHYRNLAQSAQRPPPNGNVGMSELEAQNRELQKYVASMRYGDQPKHEERYYIEKINVLNQQVKTCVKKLLASRQAMTEDQMSEFVVQLGNISLEGETTAKVLLQRNLTPKLLSQNRSRRNLFSHLLSLALTAWVLNRYVFGLEKQLANFVGDLELKILEQGRPLLSFD